MKTIAIINQEACRRAQLRELKPFNVALDGPGTPASTIDEHTSKMLGRLGWKDSLQNHARFTQFEDLCLAKQRELESKGMTMQARGGTSVGVSNEPSAAMQADYSRIAAHEAGHCLATIVMGGQLLSATVHRYGGGITHIDTDTMNGRTWPTILAAGVEAECELGFTEREMQDHGADSDRRQFENQVSYLRAFGHTDITEEGAKARAVSICASNRTALGAVQKMLLDNVGQEVSGERIAQTIRYLWKNEYISADDE